jgi:hypothetical protein
LFCSKNQKGNGILRQKIYFQKHLTNQKKCAYFVKQLRSGNERLWLKPKKTQNEQLTLFALGFLIFKRK